MLLCDQYQNIPAVSFNKLIIRGTSLIEIKFDLHISKKGNLSNDIYWINCRKVSKTIGLNDSIR